MDYKLVNYLGIDEIDNYNFDSTFPYLLEDTIDINDDICDILSFSLSRESISHKVLDIFEDSNLEGDNFYGNIVIVNNKFDVSFEYSNDHDFSKINIMMKSIYKSALVSIYNYNNSTLEIAILVKDLFCNIFSENKIFFSANLIIGINEL